MQANRRRLATAVPAVALLLGLLAACGSDGEPGTPAASEPAPVTEPDRTTITEAMSPEEEVEAAYLRSWDVYAEAVRELDPSGLEEAYADRALDAIRQEIAELGRAGHAVHVAVDHNIVHVQVIDAERGALVQDKYVNHMVLIDARSGDPLEPDPNDEIFETYQLKEIDGTWKVVAIVREPSRPS